MKNQTGFGSIILKSTIVWTGISVLAIFNAILRELVFSAMFGSVAGLAMSGILLSILIIFTAYLSSGWIGEVSVRISWLIGFYWLILTLLFEFGLGLFVLGQPFSELMKAYTFEGGNLWLLVLFVILITPRAAFRTKN
jgi:hypothetical protein